MLEDLAENPLRVGRIDEGRLIPIRENRIRQIAKVTVTRLSICVQTVTGEEALGAVITMGRGEGIAAGAQHAPELLEPINLHLPWQMREYRNCQDKIELAVGPAKRRQRSIHR